MGKSRRVVLGISLLTAVLVVFSGCSSMLDSVANAGGLLDKTEARMNQAVADAVGLGAMEDAMIASVMYAQVFYAGGYGTGYDDFREGEGVVWKITSKDKEETQHLQVERALLKRNDDGSLWWYLRYQPEGEDEFVAEALIDKDYNLLKFRYFDQETETIREWVPEQDQEADSSDTSSDEQITEDEVGYYEGDFSNYITGTETVVVPAGTYKAKHVLIEDSYTANSTADDSADYEVRYEWWIADDVPGDLVKYDWNNITENSSLSGELISHKTGYTTKLKSY